MGGKTAVALTGGCPEVPNKIQRNLRADDLELIRSTTRIRINLFLGGLSPTEYRTKMGFHF